MSLVDDDIPAWLESNILSRICDVADRGETLAQMFDRCLDFDSKSEFALAVRHCVASGQLVHVGQRYYKPEHAVVAAAAAAVQKAAALPQPVKRVYQRKKHFGDLLPNTEIGKVALALCVFERHLTCDEIIEYSRVPCAGRHLQSLCNRMYAYHRGVKIRTFCWAQAVDYPFAKFCPSDFADLSLPSLKVNALRKKLCQDT